VPKIIKHVDITIVAIAKPLPAKTPLFRLIIISDAIPNIKESNGAQKAKINKKSKSAKIAMGIKTIHWIPNIKAAIASLLVLGF